MNIYNKYIYSVSQVLVLFTFVMLTANNFNRMSLFYYSVNKHKSILKYYGPTRLKMTRYAYKIIE